MADLLKPLEFDLKAENANHSAGWWRALGIADPLNPETVTASHAHLNHAFRVATGWWCLSYRSSEAFRLDLVAEGANPLQVGGGARNQQTH